MCVMYVGKRTDIFVLTSNCEHLVHIEYISTLDLIDE